jgi:hypothetical protein
MDADLEAAHKEVERTEDAELLSPQSLYRHDPLFVLLKDTLHLNEVWMCLGTMLLPGCVFLCWWLWASHLTRWWLLSDTISVLLQTFVLFPLIFFLYLQIPHSIASLFNTLKANGVIREQRTRRAGPATFAIFVQYLTTWMDSNWWTVLILLLVAAYAIYRLLVLEPGSPSPVPYWMRAAAILVYLPLMYAVGMSVIRLLLALFFTNWLFALFHLQVKPFHPDGAGGLGILGRLVWVCIAIMLWEALLLVATVLSQNLHWLSLPEMVLLGAIYIVLTPALLLGWLIFPHRAMVNARNEVLQPLVTAYQQALEQSITAKEETRTIVAQTRRLQVLKQRYDLLCETFPTWPLEIGSLRRIAVTIILPLILPLLTSLIAYGLHLLGIT